MIGNSFNLGFNLNTSQKLTPQMQQAIKLLQLSSLELEQEVQNKLDSNPMLERVEEDNINAEDFNSIEELTRLELNENNEHDAYDNYDTGVDEYSNSYDENGYDENSLDSSFEDKDYDDFNYSNDDLNSNIYDEQDSYHLAEDNSDSRLKADKSQDATNEIRASEIPVNTKESSSENEDTTLDKTLGELEIDTDWEDIYTHSPTSMASPDTDGMTDYQGATSSSLQDHIRWQLNFKHLSDVEILIADYLIDAMDDNGFIQMEVSELKSIFDEMASFYQWEDSVDDQQIQSVIFHIQACDPLGVGARNLAECLQIQLRVLDDSVAYRDKALKLLDEHALLVSNNISELIKRTGVKKHEISACIELIRTLNAAPGLAFSKAQPDYGAPPEAYDIPDVIVKLEQKEGSLETIWKVELNPDTLPKLRVNAEYANLVKRGDDSPDNVYLRDNLVDARLFIRSIEERNQNLLKVATCIVMLQQDFLLKGPTAMKPLILKDVADTVELHESTVSRLTTNKNILTPQGLFSLKHFFSSHVSSDQGDISSTAISAMIKKFINEEDPQKPLSDSAIMQLLEAEGIDIARRTVAKYREAMNIGSSTQRRQKF